MTRRPSRRPSRPAPRAPKPTYTLVPSPRAQAALRAIFEPPAPPDPLPLEPGNGSDIIEWWHIALAARDAAALSAAQAEKAALAASIRDNNDHVAALASGLDLEVRPIYETGIIQFDAFAMARRIEAASARHGKKPKPNRATNKNRQLAFRCPTCSTYNEKRHTWSNTIRTALADRILLCAGRYGAEHPPAVCELIPESQPDYRLAALAAGTASDPDANLQPTLSPDAKGQHDRATAIAAGHKRRYAAQLAAQEPDPIDSLTKVPHSDIPF